MTATTPRQCFVILPTQYEEGRGYIPSLVIENESGHYPMTGGPDQEPWYWGDTIERAEQVCARFNLDRYGISKATAARIVGSTMH